MQAIARLFVTSSESTSAAKSSAPTKDQKRMGAAATEFESVMLGQWMQSAESSFGAAPGGDEDEDAGGQQMKSFAVQQLATHLASHGGVGIARLVQQGLVKARDGDAVLDGKRSAKP